MSNQINLDDPNFNQQVVVKDTGAKALWVVIGIIVAIAIFIVIGLYNAGGGSSEYGSLHDNCMFIGYADPNRPLDGSSHVSSEPQYGYRPVYTQRDDIYNTYHFH